MGLRITYTGLVAGLFILLAGCSNTQDQSNAGHNMMKADLRGDTLAVSTTDSIATNGTAVETPDTTDHRGLVKRNDSFYKIFVRLGISPRQIYELTRQYGDKLDLFQLKPGQNYRYSLLQTDSVKHLTRFIWMPSARDEVVISFRDSLSVKLRRKPVNTKLMTATGVIESSLYETFIDQDLSIELAYKLSDLFAWQIDFFLLREGDAFKVIYTQEYVDGKKVGIGNVLAAEFRHRDEIYEGYRFFNGTEMGYYDRKGESLQKALLKAPLRFRYISSGYSHSRYHPILHRRMPHYGIDYVAPRGTPVVSVGDGTVVTAGYSGPNGNMVKIRHNGVYSTTYIHLSRFADGVRRGTNVEQGEVIGYVGSTGRSTGSHLDYRLYKNGSPVNPRTIKLPPSKSIDEKYMGAFEYASGQLDEALNQMEFANTKPKTDSVTESRKINNDADDAGKSS